MAEVGEKLQEARKAKGYTLDDLQQITKIQKRYLIAIEEGNYNVMPGKFYARAFIKQYADTVGLNGDQLLEEYDDTVPHTHDEEFVEKVSSSQTRSGNKKQDSFLEKVQDHLPTILIVLLVIAIVVAIYVAVTNSASNNSENMISVDSSTVVSSENESSAQEEEESSAEESSQSESEESESAPSVELVSSTGSSSVYSISSPEETNTVTLAAEGGDTWVSIAADGSMVEQGLVSDGDTLDAEVPAGTQSVVMIIGSAPNTTIQLNGQAIEYAPEASENVRQEIELQFETNASGSDTESEE
ncbi:helix-turn-helix domain-containing protein [Desemzia sp. FAM 24101]|uniref:helix-turn-helix domain-containing protein n=1 Tax=unclassified Desemzia TaxID=2685243 RepID=UPI003885A4DC